MTWLGVSFSSERCAFAGFDCANLAVTWPNLRFQRR